MNKHQNEVRRRAALAIAKNIVKGIRRPRVHKVGEVPADFFRELCERPPRLFGKCGPVIVLDEAAITPEAKAEFMRAFKEFATKPMQVRAMYSDRPQVHRVHATFIDAPKYCPPFPMGFVIPWEGNVIQEAPDPAPPSKLYRVFYDCGVYEWYINDGPAPRWQYLKRGVLMGAFNVAAQMCAPLAR